VTKPSKPLAAFDEATLTTPRPGLHVVATPIGNLGDITLRALKTLAHADAIYCEDTRQTRKLLQRYGIDSKLRTYHEHNAEEARPEILERLAAGEIVALVSDAGTPLISDPGFKLVRESIAAGHPVTSEPGASAVMTALAIAGMPTDRFLFLGFLAPKQTARRQEIMGVKDIAASLVLFESPSRLGATLADLAECLGARPAAVARELTKLYEEVIHGSLIDLAGRFKDGDPPKGEIVIVVAPPGDEVAPERDLDGALKEALAAMPLKMAVATVSARLGLPRRTVYARALELNGKAQ
jgi:16S rRNA (cytidine1402-2'-O)-methyltransferase